MDSNHRTQTEVALDNQPFRVTSELPAFPKGGGPGVVILPGEEVRNPMVHDKSIDFEWEGGRFAVNLQAFRLAVPDFPLEWN